MSSKASARAPTFLPHPNVITAKGGVSACRERIVRIELQADGVKPVQAGKPHTIAEPVPPIALKQLAPPRREIGDLETCRGKETQVPPWSVVPNLHRKSMLLASLRSRFLVQSFVVSSRRDLSKSRERRLGQDVLQKVIAPPERTDALVHTSARLLPPVRSQALSNSDVTSAIVHAHLCAHHRAQSEEVLQAVVG